VGTFNEQVWGDSDERHHGISAAVRAATGLRGGDPVDVTLTLATTPREVDVPADLAAALSAAPGTADFFATLSNSVQRFHIDTVNGAKTPETGSSYLRWV
jgi:hypothetical protein